MEATSTYTTFRKRSYPKFGPTTRTVNTVWGVEHYRVHDGAYVATVRQEGNVFVVEAAITGAFGVKR